MKQSTIDNNLRNCAFTALTTITLGLGAIAYANNTSNNSYNNSPVRNNREAILNDEEKYFVHSKKIFYGHNRTKSFIKMKYYL